MPDFVQTIRSWHVQPLLKLLLPALVSVTLYSAPMQAEIYKWEDEDGRVHYGDKPGNETAHEIEIDEPSGKQQTTQSLERKVKRQKLLNLFAEEREEKRREKIDRINERITRKNNCNKAKKHRTDILASGYIYEEDDAGNKRILSTEEFEEHLAKTQAMIEKFCS